MLLLAVRCPTWCVHEERVEKGRGCERIEMNRSRGEVLECRIKVVSANWYALLRKED